MVSPALFFSTAAVQRKIQMCTLLIVDTLVNAVQLESFSRSLQGQSVIIPSCLQRKHTHWLEHFHFLWTAVSHEMCSREK